MKSLKPSLVSTKLPKRITSFLLFALTITATFLAAGASDPDSSSAHFRRQQHDDATVKENEREAQQAALLGFVNEEDQSYWKRFMEETDASMITPTTTIVEILTEDSRFTTLVSLVSAAGLVPPLEGEGPLTVFAPTNEAFAGVDTSGLTEEQIKNILLYHVAEGRVPIENNLSVTTLEGSDVLITVSEAGAFVNGETIEEDLEGSNGIIYVIDGVLIPPTPTKTIVEILTGDNRFTTLVSLVSAAGLVPPLEGEGPLTVFAPTNEAFAGVDTSGLTEEQIKNILLYHVAEGRVPIENNLSVTTLEGSDVLITVSEAGAFVNDETIEEDLEGSNGIIYVIKGVLIPPL